jgi:hypothetical protein
MSVQYMISARMDAGTGGNSSLRPLNGMCVVRQTESLQSLNDKIDFYMSYCHRLLTCKCCMCACRYVIDSPRCYQKWR